MAFRLQSPPPLQKGCITFMCLESSITSHLKKAVQLLELSGVNSIKQYGLAACAREMYSILSSLTWISLRTCAIAAVDRMLLLQALPE